MLLWSPPRAQRAPPPPEEFTVLREAGVETGDGTHVVEEWGKVTNKENVSPSADGTCRRRTLSKPALHR